VKLEGMLETHEKSQISGLPAELLSRRLKNPIPSALEEECMYSDPLPTQDSIDGMCSVSWKMIISVLTCVALFCAGCVSTGELAEHPNIQGALPADAQSAVIRAMPMSPGTIKNVEKLSLTDAPPLFAGYLKDALALKRPGWQIKLAGDPGTTSGQDLTITTELLEIDGGSAALRFWIGFNTGSTLSRARVSILDAAGKDLANAKISERTDCPVGACTESNEASIERNLKSLAEEVAEFIVDPAAYDKKKGSKPKT
jgi:hypothetical protein